jgi:hypothetical protein
MFRLRIVAVALLVALVGAGWLQGQGNGKKGDEKPKKLRGTLPQFYKKLGLRDDQVQQIYKIQMTHKAKIDELKRQIDDLKAKQKEATEKVLTPEQLKRLRELRSGTKVTPPAEETKKPVDKKKD